MKKNILSFIFVIAFTLVSTVLPITHTYAAPPVSLTQIDVGDTNSGSYTDGCSYKNNISTDGRYVVFCSSATGLVADDTNGIQDIFLRDTQTNTTTRISLSTAGDEGDGASYNPSISSDGRYVTFSSDATNLVADDTNGIGDIFLRDTQTNTTTRVSVSSAGDESDGDSSYGTSISSDGRYVTFSSDATNLVADDTNGSTDVFIRDTQTNTTTRISLSTAGDEGDSDSYYSVISADARYVVFGSYATNLVASDTNGYYDIFLRDTQTNTTTRVSVSSAGGESNSDNIFYERNANFSISADGRYIVFSSPANNLVEGDTNEGKKLIHCQILPCSNAPASDIFLRDTQANTTTRVSLSNAGGEANNDSYYPDISADGRYVTFESDATNLVSDDTNGATDVFIRDVAAGTTNRVSVSTSGGEGDGESTKPSISPDGTFVGFASYATNLLTDSTPGEANYFLAEVTLGPTIEAPTVTTGGATTISKTKATLAGNITATGGNVSTRGFEYGPDTSYGSSTSTSGSYSTGAFTVDATSLSCDTLYHYRAYASNSGGTSYGEDSTFTTVRCSAPDLELALYGVGYDDNTNDTNLYTIDPATGSILSTIGTIGYDVSSFDSFNNTFYGVTQNNELVSINKDTGAGTLLGTLLDENDNQIYLSSISFKSDGTLYGFSTDNNGLYTIDTNSCDGETVILRV